MGGQSLTCSLLCSVATVMFHGDPFCISSAITSTEFPDYNIEFDADVMKNPKHLETSLDLHYGSDSKDLTKRILINQELDFSGNWKNINIDHVAKLKWRAMVC